MSDRYHADEPKVLADFEPIEIELELVEVPDEDQPPAPLPTFAPVAPRAASRGTSLTHRDVRAGLVGAATLAAVLFIFKRASIASS